MNLLKNKEPPVNNEYGTLINLSKIEPSRGLWRANEPE